MASISSAEIEAATATATATVVAEDTEMKSVKEEEETETGEKRIRNEEDEPQNGVVLKKHKSEDVSDQNSTEEKESVGPVGLGPKTFETSMEMFNYFYKFLHHWPLNFPANKYEHLVLSDLIKKGHPEPEKKIGPGVNAFEIRYHPQWQSRCFFVVRDDKSVEDFSFRKCVDHILPLPENMKIKSEGHGNGKKGGGGGGGRGGRGGRRGGGRSRR